MEISDKRSAVLSMKDEALQTAVKMAAQACGMQAEKAAELAADPEAVRKRLLSFCEEDITAMLGKLTPQQKEALNRMIQQNQKT